MRSKNRFFVPQPSLFSFLSVLLCLIGVLMLIAIVVAPSALISASSNVEIWIDFESSEHKKIPIPLECTKGTAKSLDGKYLFVEDIESNESEASNETPFRAFLNELSSDIINKKRNNYVFFLIRPDGVSVYNVLLEILKNHNKNICSRTVYISGEYDKKAEELLPRSLLSKLNYDSNSNELTFFGVMSIDDLNNLKRLFPQESSLKALLTLYEKSQTAVGYVDYGTELIPKEWKKIHIANIPNNNDTKDNK